MIKGTQKTSKDFKTSNFMPQMLQVHEIQKTGNL